jgi:hypothetical protein
MLDCILRLIDPVLDRVIEHRFKAVPVGDDYDERKDRGIQWAPHRWECSTSWVVRATRTFRCQILQLLSGLKKGSFGMHKAGTAPSGIFW